MLIALTVQKEPYLDFVTVNDQLCRVVATDLLISLQCTD